MATQRDAAFEDFVSRRSTQLLRTAYLLTGDRGHAEDLLQTALLKTYRHWDRLRDREDPAAFVRRVMATSYAMSWRRRRVFERLTGEPPELGTQNADGADRDELWRALATLPPRMRAVLVLRYWEDLSEAETAAVLDCSLGTVKRQASRGLARLRGQLTVERFLNKITEDRRCPRSRTSCGRCLRPKPQRSTPTSRGLR